jgi:hypothetical protein
MWGQTENVGTKMWGQTGRTPFLRRVAILSDLRVRGSHPFAQENVGTDGTYPISQAGGLSFQIFASVGIWGQTGLTTFPCRQSEKGTLPSVPDSSWLRSNQGLENCGQTGLTPFLAESV